jgi:hypothetical protein
MRVERACELGDELTEWPFDVVAWLLHTRMDAVGKCAIPTVRPERSEAHAGNGQGSPLLWEARKSKDSHPCFLQVRAIAAATGRS